ncbi:hypothetical protein H6P81_009628 [Aristolochia fimbriata]|uniref:RING-type E3 ubiquitin transferase n=1 Tax=Aristolochia fimbriata TaxID=158543 RepID=A0AAV7ELF7_ARIFI|nr:hypothetical protein H6P81_009628 [Aristolochia fimbriata]
MSLGLESGVWSLESGVWSLESGVWSLESGVWSLESGVWSLESGVWSLESGVWSLESGVWSLESGVWSLESGVWSLESGVWSLESGVWSLESGVWSLESGVWSLESGVWSLESGVWSLESGVWSLESGVWSLESGVWSLESGVWSLESGVWSLESGVWSLESGVWSLESGVWSLESGVWSLESGVWSLESGVWSLESGVWSLESGVWSLEDQTMSDTVAEEQGILREFYRWKVHSLMCKELKRVVERVIQILPSIESARPGCTTGIQALCSVNLAIEKAKLLLEYCAESSKLYLAMTGHAVVSRCERARDAMDLNLCQIRDMVPLLLAVQISEVIDDIRGAKFIMESSEQEAGRVIVALFQKGKSVADSTEDSELEAFKMVSLKLHITTSKALLIEKRALKKLLEKIRDSDLRKERTLKYLLYLLRKYEEQAGCQPTACDSQLHEIGFCLNVESPCNCTNNENADESNDSKTQMNLGQLEAHSSYDATLLPPKEYLCPISSKIMYDPVIIASGQTYERTWIKRWFAEGHNTCPMTQKKLSHLSLTPNTCVKELISNWCQKHGVPIPNPCLQPIPEVFSTWKNSSLLSIDSFGSSLNDVPTQLLSDETKTFLNEKSLRSISISSSADASYFLDLSQSHMTENKVYSVGDHSVSFCQNFDDCHMFHSFDDFSHDMYVDFFLELSGIPLESQVKTVRGFKIFLNRDEARQSLVHNGFVQAVLRFLKDAHEQSDVNAQSIGCQILAAFMSKSRLETPCLDEDAFQLLACLIVNPKLSVGTIKIMQMLSTHRCCYSKISASGILASTLEVVDCQVGLPRAKAIKLLCHWSEDSGIGSSIISLGCIRKLIPLLSVVELAGSCCKILRNLLSVSDDIKIAVAEARGFCASIIELLDNGTSDEQELAVALLLSLCSDSSEYCQLVMNDGVVPALVCTSINGNTAAKKSSMKLLQLLRDFASSDLLQGSSELSQESGDLHKEKQSSLKEPGFLKRKLSLFFKPKSLAFF